MEEKKKEKRGAPKGNQYARTHGFYAKVLDRAQKRDMVVANDADGIDDEIALLRTKLKAVLEKDPENIKLLMAATATLAGLLKVRTELNKNQKKSVTESIGKVIQEMAVQAGVHVASSLISKKIG